MGRLTAGRSCIGGLDPRHMRLEMREAVPNGAGQGRTQIGSAVDRVVRADFHMHRDSLSLCCAEGLAQGHMGMLAHQDRARPDLDQRQGKNSGGRIVTQ